jgi:DNA replication initiation complex subunit (GINS family)
MELDVNSLGEFLRKERASPSLQPVNETFYSELGKLLRDVDEKYPPYSRESENLRNLINDIFNSREKKLVLFAISYARSGEDDDAENTTPEERELFRNLVAMLKERRASLEGGKKGKSKASLKKQRIENAELSPDKAAGKSKKQVSNDKKGSGDSQTITLRIVEDLPPIVGTDGKTYGAFNPEDIVALPERNAKIFIKHGYGEPIDFKL